VDRGQHATCCRTADPEVVASEPEVFDCETCEFRCQVDGLAVENAEAWRTYGRLMAHRWVWDADCGPWWIGEVFRGIDPDERDDLMDRISVIYDTLHPPKERGSHGA
jgi:hypothetical protein